MKGVIDNGLSEANLSKMVTNAKENKDRTMSQDKDEIVAFLNKMEGKPLVDDIDKKTPWEPLPDDGIVASEGVINERRRVRGEDVPDGEEVRYGKTA